MPQTVGIPVRLFKKFLRANEAFGELHEAFEDYVISINPALLRKLRKARREDLAGKTRPFVDLKRQLNIHSRSR